MFSQEVSAENPAKSKLMLSERAVPLRVLPFYATVESVCQDCGLSNASTISELVNEARLGSRTIQDLEDAGACTRTGCGGSLKVSLSIDD